MSEPMRKKRDETEEENDVQNDASKKSGFLRKGISRVKSDIQYGSRVEEGSLVDGARKTFRALFPKK